MAKQIQVIIISLLLVMACGSVWAQDSSTSAGTGGGPFAYLNQKYSERKAERFDIISYLTNQKKIMAAQDAKYGGGGGGAHGFRIHPDLVLSYMSEPASLTRDDGSTLGKAQTTMLRAQFLANDLISQGGPRRLINIDVGIEAYNEQIQSFTADASTTQSVYKTSESGAALLLRPFGRSSQDTGLMLKIGYLNLSETGLWATSNTSARSLGSLYFAGEAKLYLLPFLGLQGEYQGTPLQSSSAIGGSWQLSRWRYGGFVEFYMLAVGALITDSSYKFTQTGSEVTDSDKGVTVFASLFF